MRHYKNPISHARGDLIHTHTHTPPQTAVINLQPEQNREHTVALLPVSFLSPLCRMAQ